LDRWFEGDVCGARPGGQLLTPALLGVMPAKAGRGTAAESRAWHTLCNTQSRSRLLCTSP
jgi:hypothetical protein